MKKINKIHTMRSISSRFVGLLIALFIMIPATAGSIFATPPEDAKVWRVQMRFQTANVDDAETDDSVRVRLNSTNSTWLDYGRDDFPRNNTFTYDLKMDGISQISDLHYIYISKTGSDGLGLKSFALLINGREIYTQIFPGSVHWLDNDSSSSPTYFVSSYTMRQDNSWLAYTQPAPPLRIPRAEMESRIEGLVGDFITGNLLYWGHKYGRAYVEVAKKPNALNTLHVDLDLSADVTGFDPEVDVDFDIEVRCVNNPVTLKSQIVLDIKNVVVVVDSDWYAEVLSLGIYQYIDSYVNGQLSQALKGINVSQNIGVPFCPVIDVDIDGDINFSLPGPGPVIGVFTLAKQASAMKAEISETIVDEDTPLALNVEIADEIQADAATTYTLLVKSNRSDATNITAQVELPATLPLVDTLIEVVDTNGKRPLAPQITAGENGGVRLSFNDRLEAGAENHYRLSVRFASAPKADLQINAAVAVEGGDAAIKSATFFQLENGALKARGTFQAAKAVKAAPVTGRESKQDSQ